MFPALLTLPAVAATSGLVIIVIIVTAALWNAACLPPGTPHGAAAAKPAERSAVRAATDARQGTEVLRNARWLGGRSRPKQPNRLRKPPASAQRAGGSGAACSPLCPPAPRGLQDARSARGVGAPFPPHRAEHLSAAPRQAGGPGLPFPRAQRHRHPEWRQHCWER